VTTRRNPGEGGLHWEESRQRWFATVYVGYSPDGKRRKVKVSARTKTEAKGKLQQLLRDRDDGHVLGGQTYTVRDAVESWLAHWCTIFLSVIFDGLLMHLGCCRVTALLG
jgi:hypothetical protein